MALLVSPPPDWHCSAPGEVSAPNWTVCRVIVPSLTSVWPSVGVPAPGTVTVAPWATLIVPVPASSPSSKISEAPESMSRLPAPDKFPPEKVAVPPAGIVTVPPTASALPSAVSAEMVPPDCSCKVPCPTSIRLDTVTAASTTTVPPLYRPCSTVPGPESGFAAVRVHTVEGYAPRLSVAPAPTLKAAPPDSVAVVPSSSVPAGTLTVPSSRRSPTTMLVVLSD